MKYEIFNKYWGIITAVFIIGLGIFIQYPYMNEFPSYIHAWSQSDRYSIAIGFLNNDFDLFHPETLIYNKQFPHWWTYAYDNTITSVDFPLVEYIVAIVMKITGSTSPWIFRSCTLLLSFLGLFFLYKLSFLITKDGLKSLLVIAVAMTSPVYAYYSNGFIPGIPALTFAIIALYFYVRYLDDKSIRLFIVSSIFITLSVLIRMSFAVIWIAILCYELLRIIRKETTFADKILPVGISFVVFFSYYQWNKHLAAVSGTMFLGELMPAENWSDFYQEMTKTLNNWKFHYFGKIHYNIFLLITVFAFLYFIFCKIENIRSIKSESDKSLSLWVLFAITILGEMLFTLAMARQFRNHDYYFIDTYFLPLLLLLILILNILPRIENYKRLIFFGIITILFITLMTDNVGEMQKKRRRNYWAPTAVRTINNYQGSEQYLDSIGISEDAKILTLWAYPQSTPFIFMNRKGYAEMYYDKEKLDSAMTFDYDYVVIENELYDKEKNGEWRYIFEELEYHSDNGKIMIFERK